MNQTYELLSSLSNDTHAGVTALNNYRLFEVKGPGAKKFLQGQVTSDLQILEQQGHGLSAHCNIKGHIFSLFRVFRLSDEHYLASIHQSIAESGFNNLKKYSIFSKVELSFVDDWSGVAVSTEGLSKLGLGEQPEPLFKRDDLIAAKLGDELYEVWGDDSGLASTVRDNVSTVAPESTWYAGLIQLGIPSITDATQEHFIPQMVNLQAVNGVSFSKGCYTGQEIVTRLQHRGILKKAMYPFHTESTEIPAPGQAVVDNEGTAVGEIVSAAAGDSGSVQLLAVIQQSQIDEGNALKLENGSELNRLELPYTLDPKMFEKKR